MFGRKKREAAPGTGSYAAEAVCRAYLDDLLVPLNLPEETRRDIAEEYMRHLLDAADGLQEAGHSVPFLHDTGWIGIGVSLVIVTVAALNLVLDFDFIESGTHAGAPKYMEWYGAFGLLVTLVWLYLEILRLLAKLRSRN
jgi:hypothetical protein